MLIAGVFSIILYGISLLLLINDPNHTYRYLILDLYLSSLLIVVLAYLFTTIKKSFLHKIFQPKELLFFSCILILVGFISLYHISSYPFVNLGDGVRDAGLDPMRIVTGEMANFFNYGNYNGYGKIIPLFGSFFYQLFGNTVFTYRIPGAIIAILDVILFYILLRQLFTKPIAALGAAVLALFPLHMYFARVELVVIFDSFWTTALLLSFYLWTKRRKAIDYVMLGTLIGFAATFHTPARIVALLLLIVVVITAIRKHAKYVFFFLIFCFVGFGPLLLASNTETFFQKTRYSPERVLHVQETYIRSLAVWVSEGTTSRYPIHQPLLTIPLFYFFIIGVIRAFTKKNTFFFTLLMLAFVLPFTNSAMTDWINADHRLLPFLPIGALFIALGLSFTAHTIKNIYFKNTLYVLFFLYLLTQPYHFFTQFPANADRTPKDYLSMHIIQFMTTKNSQRDNLCIVVSPQNYNHLDLAHNKEQRKYFLPQTTITVREETGISDNEAYLFTNNCPDDYTEAKEQYTIVCSGKKVNECPVNYMGDIMIFSSGEASPQRQ